jgi:hypothetical protein
MHRCGDNFSFFHPAHDHLQGDRTIRVQYGLGFAVLILFDRPYWVLFQDNCGKTD